MVKHVMGPFVCILLATLGVLIAMTIVDPPYWTHQVFIEDDDNVDDDWKLPGADSSYGYCDEPDPYGSVISALLLVSLVVAFCMSCRTRRIPEEFSDSRRVCQTLCSQIVVQLLGILVIGFGVVFGNIVAYVVAQIMVDFLSVVSIFVFLFAPKMYYVAYERRHGRLPDGVLAMGRNVHVSGLTGVPQSTNTATSLNSRKEEGSHSNTREEQQERISEEPASERGVELPTAVQEAPIPSSPPKVAEDP
jgi:hypothetical protein